MPPPERHRRQPPEPKLPQNEFKVEVRGEESLHHFIYLLNQASENPMVHMRSLDKESREEHDDITIELGRLDLKDRLFDEMRTGLTFRFENSNYELRTLFLSQTTIEARNALLELRVDQKNPMTPARLRDAISKLTDDSPPVDLSLVAEMLKSQMLSKKYNPHFDQNWHRGEGAIIFDDPEGKVKDYCVLHAPGPGFCLHLERSADQDFETFRKNYQEYTSLISPVTEAIYRTGFESVPKETYFLETPPWVDKETKRLDMMVSASKKQMSLMGLDDGQELAEEVKEKMILKQKPTETFNDIGGLGSVKEDLEEVIDALKNPGAFNHWGTEYSRATLLHGPPGTGKTLLAKATANAANATIYVVNCADVIHHLYGKEQRIINEVFNQARKNNQPSVIFFDEMDALFSHRDTFNHITSQNVSVLQVNLDGLIPGSNENLIVIGATNRLDAIDTSLLRPGRFNNLVEVKLPDPAARKEIFTIHMRLRNERAHRELFNGIDMDKLAEATNKFSGDDIKELIRRALGKKVRQERKGQNPTLVTTEDILNEITNYEQIRLTKEKVFKGFEGVKS